MNKKFKYLVIASLMLVSLAIVSKASAATVSIVSEIQSVSAGKEFNVNFLVDTDVKINAVDGIVTFDPKVLQMVSVDRSRSIFNFWVEDPTISNVNGTMSFTGGTADSKSGTSLNVLTMKFRATGAGASTVTFTQGTIAADDGLGTNVLSVIKDTKITVSGTTSGTVTPPTTPKEEPTQIERKPTTAKQVPEKPIVRVTLYPDQEKWYNQIGDVIVFWDLPSDIISVASVVDKNPNTIPENFDKKLFNGKQFGSLKEGIYYVHVRFRNNVGKGATTHFKISIDVTSPLPFSVVPVGGQKTDNPTPTIKYATQDSLSGVEHYHIFIDGQEALEVKESMFKLPILAPGDHNIMVEANDKAGNISQAVILITILPIESPKINFVTQPYYSDSENVLLISGAALPKSSVLLTIEDSTGVAARATASVDEKGQWAYSFTDTLKNGSYKIIAQTQDERGALSLLVSSNFSVKSKPIFKLGIVELGLIQILILLSVILVAGFVGGFVFFRAKQERIERRVVITGRDLTNMIVNLREDVKKLAAFVKKSGDYDEGVLVKKLEEDLDRMDKNIKKEIEKIGN